MDEERKKKERENLLRQIFYKLLLTLNYVLFREVNYPNAPFDERWMYIRVPYVLLAPNVNHYIRLIWFSDTCIQGFRIRFNGRHRLFHRQYHRARFTVITRHYRKSYRYTNDAALFSRGGNNVTRNWSIFIREFPFEVNSNRFSF